MALGTIGAGGLNICVDLRHRWQCAEVAMAGITCSSCGIRDMVRWHRRPIEIAEAGVARRALAQGMICISDKKGACSGLRSSLETLERRTGGDRVLFHTNPHKIRVMAAGTATCHSCVNHGSCRYGQLESRTWNGLAGIGWHIA